MLKSWAVRRLEGVLSDYLDDVSPDAVRASLGKDTGTLDLNARIKSSALAPLPLRVLDSSLKVRVRIPWRRMHSENTVVEVGLKIEVQMDPIKSSQHLDQEARREKKLEEIASLEAKKEASQGGPSASAGMVVKTSHAVLRQLVVKIEGLTGSLHRERPAEQLHFSLAHARLESLASDWVSPPPEDQKDLYKALDISGLSLRFSDGPALLWPLTLQARLHHSQVQGLAHLRLSVPGDSPVSAEVLPSTLTYVLGIVDWYMDLMASQTTHTSDDQLPPGAGRDYAVEYCRRLRGEPFDGKKLREIEEVGSVAWIVEWRSWCKAQLKAAESPAERKPTWWEWTTGKVSSSTPAAQDDDSIVALLDRAQQEDMLPAVAPPTKAEVEFQIPQAQLQLKAASHKLQLSSSGLSMHLKAHAEAKHPVNAEEAVHLWHTTTQVQLRSLEALLDEETIIELKTGSKSGDSAEATSGSKTEENLPADVRALLVGQGQVDAEEVAQKCLSITVTANQREATSPQAPPVWEVGLRFRKEAMVVHLAPWTIHGFLAMGLDFQRAVVEGSGQRKLYLDDGEAAPSTVAIQEDNAVKEDEQKVEGDPLLLQVDVMLQAPIIYLNLPQHGTRLRADLGSFYAVTGKKEAASGDVKPDFVPISAMAATCELKDARLAYRVKGGQDISFFEPSTVSLTIDGKSIPGQLGLSIGAEVLSCRVDPDLARCLGLLKLGMEYAMLPLTTAAATAEESSPPPAPESKQADGAAAPGKRPAWRKRGTVTAEEVMEAMNGEGASKVEKVEKVAETKVDSSGRELATLQVSVRLQRAEATYGDKPDIRAVVGRLEGMTATYASYSSRAESQVRADQFMFESGGAAVIETAGALNVDIFIPPERTDVIVQVPGIMVHWKGDAVLELMNAGQGISRGMSSGEELALRMLPPGADQGMAVRLWNQYVSQLSQQLQANLSTQLGKYGFAGDAEELANELLPAIVGAAETAAQSRAVQVRVGCEQVSVDIYRSSSESSTPALAISARCLSGTFDYQASGVLIAGVKLTSVDVILEERLLLARRYADTELLSLEARAEPAPASAMSVELSWAQVAIVYRQRDLDRLLEIITEVMDVVSPSSDTSLEAGAAVVTSAPAEAADAIVPSDDKPAEAQPKGPEPTGSKADGRTKLSYTLSVAAPLVYLPMDEYAVTQKATTRGGRLRVDDGKLCVYEPPVHEGLAEAYAEIDFGHLSLKQGETPEQVDCKLQRVQAFNYIRRIGEDGGLCKLEVLHPVSFNLCICMPQGAFEVYVDVILNDSEEQKKISHLTLTRAQVTQWIDIAFMNFSYTLAEKQLVVAQAPVLQRELSARGTARATQLVQATAEKARDLAKESVSSKPFLVALRWAGRVRLATKFTEVDSTSIASLELENGFLDLRGHANGTIEVTLGCKCGSVVDSRPDSRNANRQLLELDGLGDESESSLHVSIVIPQAKEQALDVNVTLTRPVVAALPRLLMDLLTWALSTFQQSAQGKASATSSKEAMAVTTTAGQAAEAPAMQDVSVTVNIVGAAICLASSWESLDNSFQLSGDVVVGLLLVGPVLHIKQITVDGGRLQRTSAVGLLCARWECNVSGDFQSEEDKEGQCRLGKLDLARVAIPPLRIRLSVVDLMLLGQALTELGNMEAESAEPAEELRARDPLALVFRNRFWLQVAVKLQGLHLQLIDDGGGRAAARPALEVELNCQTLAATVETEAGKAPKIHAFTKPTAWLRVRSYNERIGDWEPLLQYSSWVLDFAVEEDRKARSLNTSLKLSSSPLQAIVTPALVDLLARLGTAFSSGSGDTAAGSSPQLQCYNAMLVAINLSGCPCVVATTLGGSERDVPATGEQVNLESLLVDADNLLLPELSIRLRGVDEASCTVGLAAENFQSWEANGKALLVQVVMPHPPQRLVVISAPLIVMNQLPVDAEVLYLDANDKTIPVDQTAHRWTAASMLGKKVHAKEVAAPYREPRPKDKDLVENADVVPTGCIISAPLVADVRKVLVRPIPGSARMYRWSEAQDFQKLARHTQNAAMTSCESWHGDLPSMHIRVSAALQGSRHQLKLEAPFSIANACPCDITCVFRDNRDGQSWILLGHAKEKAPEHADIEVHDGFGLVRKVRPGGTENNFPVKLGPNNVLRWICNGEKTLNLKQFPDTTGMRVNRQGQQVTFTFFQHRPLSDGASEEVLVRPQEELRICDRPYAHTHVFVLLRQQGGNNQRRLVCCSPPMPVEGIREELAVELKCAGFQPVVLHATGDDDRRIVISAQFWFADSTGLDIHLAAASGQVRGRNVNRLRLPMFGDSIALLSQAACESNEGGTTSIHLSLLDYPAAKVDMPAPGTSAKVKFSNLHECVVKSEAIAKTDTFGVQCHLVSVVPALMAFNYVTGCKVGIRQQGTRQVFMLGEGESTSIHWVAADRPKRLEVGACVSESFASDAVFSEAFELEEASIGAFPIVLQESHSSKKVVCVQVDQSGSLFTLTVRGAAHCHQLVNRHPCLVLGAHFEGEHDEPSGQFVARYGESKPVGCHCQCWRKQPKLCVILADIENSRHIHKVTVDIHRAGTEQVRVSERFPIAAAVSVELRGQLAVVTVKPQLFASGDEQDALQSIVNLDILLPSLTLSVVGEEARGRPRAEALTLELGGLRMSVEQQASATMDIILNLQDLKVTLQRPRPEVVLCCVRTPCFLLQTTREDMSSRIMRFGRIRADIGQLEALFSEDVMTELQQLGADLVPTFGLERSKVLARAGVPFHLCCDGPLEPSTIVSLENVHIGEVRVNTWCSIRLNRLPSIVYTMAKISTILGSTLQADGFKLVLGAQTMFTKREQGSMSALGQKMATKYLPLLIKCALSLFHNSNLFAGGMLSRHYWNPRMRQAGRPSDLKLKLVNGKVISKSDDFLLAGVRLEEIWVWYDDAIRKIVFSYSNGDRDVVGNGDADVKAQFKLQPGEYLSQICLSAQRPHLVGLNFVTNIGRESSWYGHQKPITRLTAATQSQIWTVSWNAERQTRSLPSKINPFKGQKPMCLTIDGIVERTASLESGGGSPTAHPSSIQALQAPPMLPSLTEEGYRQVAALRSTDEMKHFIRRVARQMSLEVTNEGDLSGFAHYYSGEITMQSLARLKQELSEPKPWLHRTLTKRSH